MLITITAADVCHPLRVYSELGSGLVIVGLHYVRLDCDGRPGQLLVEVDQVLVLLYYRSEQGRQLGESGLGQLHHVVRCGGECQSDGGNRVLLEEEGEFYG